jgi:hypothetical protein
LFTPVTVAYNWIHKAAKILDNEDGLDAMGVKRYFRALLASMSRWKHQAGTLASGVAHFLKITHSYWSGLFHCYQVEGLPRTNNDLTELGRSFKRHSSFWLGSYGQLWVAGMEFLSILVTELMRAKQNKLPFFQRGLKAMALSQPAF